MSRLVRSRSRDDGFTVVELMVVVTIMGAVIAMATSAVITTMQNQRRQMERVEALNEVKVALHRVTRDIRGANPLQGPLEDARLGMAVVRTGEDRDVTFELDGDELVMVETTAAGTFTFTLAGDLDGAQPLFRYLDTAGAQLATPANPAAVAVVEIRLVRVLPEERDIEFTDRITIRNAGG